MRRVLVICVEWLFRQLESQLIGADIWDGVRKVRRRV